ncbi:MAG: hypothetical protein WBM13_02505 [Bacteroidia bacterium]
MKYDKKEILQITDTILLLGLVAIIVFQLYTTFESKQSIIENPKVYVENNYKKDFISTYGERFTEIKKVFEKPTKMGYISEENEDQSIFWTNYFLTQYYLAPHLIVKNNKTCDTILYNIYSTKQINPATNFHLNNGWHIVNDFNNGLIVLAK